MGRRWAVQVPGQVTEGANGMGVGESGPGALPQFFSPDPTAGASIASFWITSEFGKVVVFGLYG